MSYLSRKITYITLTALAASVFLIVLVRTTYDSSFVASNITAPIVSVFTPSPSTEPPTISDANSAAPIKALPVSGPALPTLTIPAIKVNAHIEDVGLTPKGNMATPERLVNVGWYKYGTPIGELGSAVIAGHVDNALAQPAVFFNLKKLNPGDDIYVTEVSGEKLHFVVTDVANYDLKTAPADMIFNDKSGHILRLITCEGIISQGQFAYDRRIVVSAVLQ